MICSETVSRLKNALNKFMSELPMSGWTPVPISDCLSEMECCTTGTIRLTQQTFSYSLFILHDIFQAGFGTKGRSELTAFADGTKLGGSSSTEGISVLPDKLDNVECWHIRNGMKFNSGKYKVMHLGIANKNLCCELGAHQLEMTEEEKNLGVFVDLKMTENSQ